MEQTLPYDSQRPLAGMRWSTVALLCGIGLALVVMVAGGVACTLFAYVWHAYEMGEKWDPLLVRIAQIFWAIYGYGVLPALAYTAVSLTAWIYKMNRDLRRLRAGTMRFVPLDAVVGWFMPYRFMIRPYEMVRELYAVSRSEPVTAFRPLIGCWWALWLLAAGTMVFGGLILSNQKMAPLEGVVVRSAALALNSGMFVASGMLLLVIVCRIDRGLREHLRKSPRAAVPAAPVITS